MHCFCPEVKITHTAPVKSNMEQQRHRGVALSNQASDALLPLYRSGLKRDLSDTTTLTNLLPSVMDVALLTVQKKRALGRVHQHGVNRRRRHPQLAAESADIQALGLKNG